jgi:hypothetical protein
MTTGKARQHGGRRDGAGRKKKVVDPTIIDRAMVELLIGDEPADQIEHQAQRHARTAMLALVKKLLSGGSESARVTAANSILDRGYGRPSVDIGGDAAPNLFSLLPPERASGGFEVVSIEVRTEARKYAALAVEVLSLIAQFGRSESAVVSAASSLLNRGCGTVGTAKLPEEFKDTRLGKREAALVAARAAASGRYATPSPPGANNRESASDGEQTSGARRPNVPKHPGAHRKATD